LLVIISLQGVDVTICANLFAGPWKNAASTRSRDPNDGRRTFLGLAPATAQSIKKWLLSAFL
jgi:hypothetical protein